MVWQTGGTSYSSKSTSSSSSRKQLYEAPEYTGDKPFYDKKQYQTPAPTKEKTTTSKGGRSIGVSTARGSGSSTTTTTTTSQVTTTPTTTTKETGFQPTKERKSLAEAKIESIKKPFIEKRFTPSPTESLPSTEIRQTPKFDKEIDRTPQYQEDVEAEFVSKYARTQTVEPQAFTKDWAEKEKIKSELPSVPQVKKFEPFIKKIRTAKESFGVSEEDVQKEAVRISKRRPLTEGLGIASPLEVRSDDTSRYFKGGIDLPDSMLSAYEIKTKREREAKERYFMEEAKVKEQRKKSFMEGVKYGALEVAEEWVTKPITKGGLVLATIGGFEIAGALVGTKIVTYGALGSLIGGTSLAVAMQPTPFGKGEVIGTTSAELLPYAVYGGARFGKNIFSKTVEKIKIKRFDIKLEKWEKGISGETWKADKGFVLDEGYSGKQLTLGGKPTFDIKGTKEINLFTEKEIVKLKPEAPAKELETDIFYSPSYRGSEVIKPEEVLISPFERAGTTPTQSTFFKETKPRTITNIEEAGFSLPKPEPTQTKLTTEFIKTITKETSSFSISKDIKTETFTFEEINKEIKLPEAPKRLSIFKSKKGQFQFTTEVSKEKPFIDYPKGKFRYGGKEGKEIGTRDYLDLDPLKGEFKRGTGLLREAKEVKDTPIIKQGERIKFIVLPSSDTAITSSFKTPTKTDFIIKPQDKIIQTPKLETTPKIKTTPIQSTSIQPRQPILPATIPKLDSTYRTPRKPTKKTETEKTTEKEPPIPFDFKLPSLEGFSIKRKTKGRIKRKRFEIYTPTLTATLFGIEGIKPDKLKYRSGLITRPLLK